VSPKNMLLGIVGVVPYTGWMPFEEHQALKDEKMSAWQIPLLLSHYILLHCFVIFSGQRMVSRFSGSILREAVV